MSIAEWATTAEVVQLEQLCKATLRVDWDGGGAWASDYDEAAVDTDEVREDCPEFFVLGCRQDRGNVGKQPPPDEAKVASDPGDGLGEGVDEDEEY
ncbi:hypothetical protein DL768_007398 [Monosporascus sp. mg162]|nr:hypothetical protein DL768_007398 [Monosporascus sp. mg162]